MRNHVIILLTLLLFSPVGADPVSDIGALLDDFHRAASEADGARYFGYFTADAVFLGTDLSERWSLEDFRSYAEPHFSKGRGWTYVPTERHIYLSDDRRTAWFDETLRSQNYGLTRGSGVLVREDGGWKLAQYHLTVPIPNALLPRVVEMIERLD